MKLDKKELKAKAKKHLEEVDKFIKTKPKQGMLISFGVGMIIGAVVVNASKCRCRK